MTTFVGEKTKRLTRKELHLAERLKSAIGGSFLERNALAKEAYTTSDFPAMFANIVNAKVEQQYQQIEMLWPKVAKRDYVDGFGKERAMQLVPEVDGMIDQNGGHLTGYHSLPVVPELSPYPAISFMEAEGERWTRKHGGRVGFSWEAFKSDKWNQIASLPDQLTEMARLTDEMNVWRLIYEPGGAGFNPQTFPSGKFLPNNPALTLESLLAAIKLAKSNPPLGTGGYARVNTISKFALIVPNGMGMAAQALLAITQMKHTDGQGNEYLTNVSFEANIEVVEVPWGSAIATNPTGNYVGTGWALVPAGGVGSQRDALLSLSMRGHETPELRIKNDTGLALGGGSIDPYSGNFDNDAIEIRIRHINHGMRDNVDLGFVASKGTGQP